MRCHPTGGRPSRARSGPRRSPPGWRGPSRAHSGPAGKSSRARAASRIAPPRLPDDPRTPGPDPADTRNGGSGDPARWPGASRPRLRRSVRASEDRRRTSGAAPGRSDPARERGETVVRRPPTADESSPSPPQRARARSRAWSRSAARRALQIDSTLGFAHALVAEATASFHRRWAAAEPLFRRALELDPNDPEPHQMFGVYLRTLGRFDEAEAEMRRAIELDPLTRHFSYQLGRVLACAGRPADAAVQFAKQLALDSIYPPAHYELAKALASQGDYDAALNELAMGARQWGDTAFGRLIRGSRGSAGYTAARLLGATRSLEPLRTRAKRAFVPPVAFAREYILLGQREESMAWLQRAFEDGDVNLAAAVSCEPEYAPLRADPRFRDLRRRMGL